nr:hypothetical protein [Candidatus Gracilibacteria bacterium]
MPRKIGAEKTTLEKYNETKTDIIPEGIILRIKELGNLLNIFFDKAFFTINNKIEISELKVSIKKSFPTVVKLRDIFKK